jgi:hypothetical protein
MNQAAIQRICSIASNNTIARSIARHVDKFTSSHKLEPVYTAHQFTAPIQDQPTSRLLSLPAELRQMIYRHVFDSGLSLHLSRRAYIQLALLETCRLIHSEAHELAFNKWYFHVLDGPRFIKGTLSRRARSSWKILKPNKSHTRNSMRRNALSQRLWTLGTRINHLRYVGITMPHSELDPLSKDNPFLLTQLPLTELTICLAGAVGGNWEKDVALYQKFMSSLLCFTPDSSASPPPPIHTLTKDKIERLIALKRWHYNPQPDDVHRMLKALETRKVVVRATHDVLWKAFVFFGLIDQNEWSLVTPHVDGGLYLQFVDEEAFQPGGVLEFGRLGRGTGGLEKE